MDSGDIEITRTDGKLGIAGWLPGRTMAVIHWRVNGSPYPYTAVTHSEPAALIQLRSINAHQETTLIKARLKIR
jgi:hypothetical protein